VVHVVLLPQVFLVLHMVLEPREFLEPHMVLELHEFLVLHMVLVDLHCHRQLQLEMAFENEPAQPRRLGWLRPQKWSRLLLFGISSGHY
jgi:hypothetical protein